jgi:hypothetical protein
VSLYYTDYAAFQRFNVSFGNLGRVLERNFAELASSIASVLIFQVNSSVPGTIAGRLVMLAAVAGAIRLSCRTGRRQYGLFGIAYCGMLLVWHYPPDERFLLPLLPLLAAGLWTELTHIARAGVEAWRHPALSRKSAAAVAFLLTGGMVAFALAWNAYASWRYLPALGTRGREARKSPCDLSEWVRRNTDARASLLAYDDALVHLYTGRAACSLRVPPKYYYEQDREGLLAFVDSFPEVMKARGIEYVLLTRGDFGKDPLPREQRKRMERALDAGGFERVFASPAGSVYRIRRRTGPES